MTTSRHDVVIVGSGAAGGWTAKKLAEAGLDVALLEAGPLFPDSRRPRVIPYAPGRQPIQSRIYACHDFANEFFVDDVDHPYTTPPDKPFTWLRCRELGGKMTMWAGLSLRMSSRDFKAAREDGFGEDWPLDYEDLRPHYDEVDVALQVSGEQDDLWHLPTGPFVQPLPGDAATALVRRKVGDRWTDRRVISGRYALAPFADILGAAVATGKVAIRPDAIVSHLEIDPKTGKADRVVFVDRKSKKTGEVRGKTIVIAASPYESVRILLNSKSSRHPAGLGNSSGLLGTHLLDHTFAVGFIGRLGIGEEAGTVYPSYIPRFTNLERREPDFLRGYGTQIRMAAGESGMPDAVMLRVLSSGEMLARRENRLTLSPDTTDAWGIPAAHIACAFSENENAMIRHQLAFLDELASTIGIEVVQEMKDAAPPGTSTHELGGARMGADARTSVLDPWSRVWDVPNVIVADGASFPSAGYQNPTLTVMALAGRASARLVEDLRSGAVT